MPRAWSYPHQDLGESVHVDGSAVVRPVVPLVISGLMPAVLGVLDSGSPISVADADLFALLGIDVERGRTCLRGPLSVGGGFERTRVFLVDLELRPPWG